VTVARHTASLTLTTAGVTPDCVSAVAVALSEACTNVIHHALASDSYQVTVVLSDGQVTVDVVDSGTACSVGHRRGVGLADPLSEGGRGLELMSALCDRAVIDVGNARGGSVHLMKRLQWREDAPLPTRQRRAGLGLDGEHI
ncbi:MAG: ATP-binding protein, partial [Nocardioidaceae bacterium]